MEFLDEHGDLRRQTPKEVDKLELTPSNNRKNSEAFLNEVNNLKNMFSDRKTIVIGICGGQSCGKSLISLYIKKHIANTEIISEKDFFVGNKERRKSTMDEKISVLNMIDDDYPVPRKQRLAEVNNLKNFDFETLKDNLIAFKDGKVANFPTWDKDKGTQ
jgi:hypothetical protein